ncbi:hypothetical protein L0668_07360 [Paraglaciecola aquimarina]|uniref:Uncharacterized protein n=1 Tax=Paraglaciecola algarum TaxID=3050085 RepID=A0ABS9D7B8_9ALTE|nr:hypothetical protein [Paraglaciecola sp. G1-23]MCF2947918.1 hypothetical protein [Paraglaciecola sp. G1-23]
MSSFNCWKCGTSQENIILPMSRREECKQCSADFHVCNMCEFFDLNKNRCDEERAEHISDPERANFCDYFKPTLLKTVNLKRYKSDAAKAKLAELFGDPIPAKKIENTSLSPAELAEKKLREMLGG